MILMTKILTKHWEIFVWAQKNGQIWNHHHQKPLYHLYLLYYLQKSFPFCTFYGVICSRTRGESPTQFEPNQTWNLKSTWNLYPSLILMTASFRLWKRWTQSLSGNWSEFTELHLKGGGKSFLTVCSCPSDANQSKCVHIIHSCE